MNNKKYLICCIFGGWFGLHYFIKGNFGKGLLYFFTLGLFLVGWVIDIFRILNFIKNINNMSVYDIDPNYKNNSKHNYVSGYINKKGKYVKGYYRK